MKTAAVIGATGLVGTELVKLLLEDDRFSKVTVFGRSSLGISHEKLEEHLINFDKIREWEHLVVGDVFFSSLGTTLKKAGSQNAQYKVDYAYQYRFAEAASKNKVPVYVLVSSAGASPDSVIFYSRMKGTLEQDVKQLDFNSINIIQPSLLYGSRSEKRTGEEIGYTVMKFFNNLGLFQKHRPMHGKEVGLAMIEAAVNATNGMRTFKLDEVHMLAKGN